MVVELLNVNVINMSIVYNGKENRVWYTLLSNALFIV